MLTPGQVNLLSCYRGDIATLIFDGYRIIISYSIYKDELCIVIIIYNL